MTGTETITLASNYGVPCLILVYVLWRGEKFLYKLIEKLENINHCITNLTVTVQNAVNEMRKKT